MEEEKKDTSVPGRIRDCAVRIVCCPPRCVLGCGRELRDTAIYCAQCPRRCREDHEKAAKKRKEKGVTRTGECVQGVKNCFTPEPGCCGETPADKCVCCYISPLNWGMYIHLSLDIANHCIVFFIFFTNLL